jgi:hypothetical protein
MRHACKLIRIALFSALLLPPVPARPATLDEVRSKVREVLQSSLGIPSECRSFLDQLGDEAIRDPINRNFFEASFFGPAANAETRGQASRYLASILKSEAREALRNSKYPVEDLAALNQAFRKMMIRDEEAVDLGLRLQKTARTRLMDFALRMWSG